MSAAQHPSAGAAPSEPDEPVERFAPTSGKVVGYTSLAVIVGLLGYLAVSVHTLTGLRLGLGLAFFGVLVWTTQLRSRAAVYPRHLHLKNSLRDTTIPLTAIDDVVVRRTLNVFVGADRYVCVGIGTPLRKLVKAKSHGPSAMLGWDKLDSYTRAQTPLNPDQTLTDYSTFVETRIAGLVEEARRSPGPARAAGAPAHSWAWPEIVALVVLGAAFALSLAL